MVREGRGVRQLYFITACRHVASCSAAKLEIAGQFSVRNTDSFRVRAAELLDRDPRPSSEAIHRRGDTLEGFDGRVFHNAAQEAADDGLVGRRVHGEGDIHVRGIGKAHDAQPPQRSPFHGGQNARDGTASASGK